VIWGTEGGSWTSAQELSEVHFKRASERLEKYDQVGATI